MSLKVKSIESITIPEGRHEGLITEVAESTSNKGGETFVYANLRVHPTDVEGLPEDFTLRWSAPYRPEVTEKSNLGKFLKAFIGWNVGDKFDLEKLVGEKCSFTSVVNQDTGFTDIIGTSFKKVE